VILASKLSILSLHRRISPGGSHRIATWSTIALSCIWAAVSVILVSVPCNPTQIITNPGSCTNRVSTLFHLSFFLCNNNDKRKPIIYLCASSQWSKWLAISILDILSEFLIFAIAIPLVYSLNMRVSAKALVIFAFSARLPVIAIAAVRLYFIHKRINGSYTFDYILATQWQMGYAIMSCTITGLGPFLKPFNKEYVESYCKHHNMNNNDNNNIKHCKCTSSYRSTSQHMISSHTSSKIPSRRPSRKSQDNISESYLMDTLPSRSTSKRTTPDADHQRRSSSPDAILQSHSPPTTSSHAPPLLLTADEHFRPTHLYRGHETEIWVGERSPSFPQEQMHTTTTAAAGGAGASRRPPLIIGKKKEFKIEIDRASRVLL
jgi:hypothetical protein